MHGAYIVLGAKQVILVGDHCQLGPVIMCKKAAKLFYRYNVVMRHNYCTVHNSVLYSVHVQCFALMHTSLDPRPLF